MLIIGSHVGYKKDTQLLGSLEEALSYNANTFMFYTGAPQNTARQPISLELTKKAIEKMKESNLDYSKVVVHAPYIINLANDSDDVRFNFAVSFLQEELKRCSSLGIKNVVLHPGSHVGLGIDRGIENIIRGLNLVLGHEDVTILLETMAGKGSEIGSKLEELKKIIDGVVDKNHIGVCIDTCHLSDAGYDITNFDAFLEEFDKIIGIEKIKCVHVNDSKNEKGTHKDRHENLGFGKIGFDTLIKIIYNEKLENVPKILETPYVEREYPPYKYEIEMIRNKKFDSNLITKITKNYCK